LLKNIRSIYNSDHFNKKAVLKILTDIETTSKFSEHRLVAHNLIFDLQRFETGQPAPDFKLRDINNKTFSINNFHGKYVYLNFYTSWCRVCTDELDSLQKILVNHSDSICVVTISEDNSMEMLSELLKKKSYTWTFLLDDTEGELLEKYGINSFPLFILIDPEGNLLQFPAPAPGEKLEKILSRSTSY
jgi:peroxiredoxin